MLFCMVSLCNLEVDALRDVSLETRLEICYFMYFSTHYVTNLHSDLGWLDHRE